MGKLARFAKALRPKLMPAATQANDYLDTRLALQDKLARAMRAMPPLLKIYLIMGGWVSDHAVVDSHMNTLHVFTGVEIGMIPPERKRLLRALT